MVTSELDALLSDDFARRLDFDEPLLAGGLLGASVGVAGVALLALLAHGRTRAPPKISKLGSLEDLRKLGYELEDSALAALRGVAAPADRDGADGAEAGDGAPLGPPVLPPQKQETKTLPPRDPLEA